MKRLLPLLLVATISATMDARTIGGDEAASIAAQFMPRAATVLKKAPSTNKDIECRPYYIFNAGDNAGFVIVAGDDRLGSILGYADKGSIDPENAPEGLRDLLNMYDAAYGALAGSGESDGAAAVVSQPEVVVAPLLGDINWGQTWPFNEMTPVYTEEGKTRHYYTGCVATAATQIMRYHSYPAQGSGSKTYTDPISGQTLSADFGATVYDWNNMPAAVPALPKTAQTEAYSTLAAHMGVALEMQYEASGSGTYDALVPYALRNYFGYDAAVRAHLRDYYPTSEWMGIIKSELDAGRPVFYGGTSDRGTDGHAFVLDGYDSADYVHVNWGWFGNSNGYFMINHLDPSSLGAGGGSGGYNLNQDMVTGIQPARGGSQRDPAIYGATRFSLGGPFSGSFTTMSYIENVDVEAAAIRVEALLTDKNGNIMAELGGVDLTIPGYSAGRSGNALFNPSNVTATVSGVADGDYRVRLGFRTGSDSPWQLLRHPKGLPAYSDVRVSGGNISIISKHEPAPDCILTAPIASDGDLYAGGAARLNVSIANRSTDFVVSSLTLRLTKADDPSVSFDASLSCNIYDQSTEELDVLMPVEASAPAGDYLLTAVIKSGSNEYAVADTESGPTMVKVLIPSGPVIRVCSPMVWRSGAPDAAEGTIRQGELFVGTVNMRNAATPGKVSVLARLTDENGRSLPLLQTDVDFTDNRPTAVSFGRYLPFDPGTYRVTYSIVDAGGAETPLSDPETTYITVSPSDKIVAEMVTFNMPEHLTQGVRTACSLTYRGLATASQNLYVRLRRLTNTSGELAYMGSQRFEPGVEKTVNFNYRPGTDLADGLYMVIAQTGSSSAQTEMGNYAVYGRVIAMGNVSSAELVEARNAVAVWAEGRRLCVAADGVAEIAAVAVYAADGRLAATSADLAALSAGLYIVRVTLTDGRTTTAKIVLR